jgi:alpha-N-arabinofuranosidase
VRAAAWTADPELGPEELTLPTARITIDPAYRVADVDRRLFGSFVEHLGRCVYGGIYEPAHPSADEHGFRDDVADLVRRLGVSVVRYPGGNFVSGYRWEDGIGPRDQRPTRLDPAWKTIETNQVGLDEFMVWAGKTGVEPMMAVNLGTRGIQEAVDILEYCNHPGGTYWSDLRRKNGALDPHAIRLWCLGNEMDGPWQVGHKTADEYGRLAAETAKAMRWVDPDVELVACGSSHSRMPTFPAWEATVLDHCYEDVDYISMHAYYEETADYFKENGDLRSFLVSGVDMDRFIESVVATCDFVAAKKRSRKRMKISFDEWNVWYTSAYHAGVTSMEWTEAPALLEDRYTVADAVVVGDMLLSLLRHADRVGVACQAQLVNVIAPIVAEPGGPAWTQTIFHPFQQAAAHAKGSVLRLHIVSPRHETDAYGDVETLSAVATYDEESGDLVLFAVNRDTDAAVDLEADLRAIAGVRLVEHTVLTSDDPHQTSSRGAAERLRPRAVSGSKVDPDQRLRATLPPVSWNMVRLRVR